MKSPAPVGGGLGARLATGRMGSRPLSRTADDPFESIGDAAARQAVQIAWSPLGSDAKKLSLSQITHYEISGAPWCPREVVEVDQALCRVIRGGLRKDEAIGEFGVGRWRRRFGDGLQQTQLFGRHLASASLARRRWDGIG